MKKSKFGPSGFVNVIRSSGTMSVKGEYGDTYPMNWVRWYHDDSFSVRFERRNDQPVRIDLTEEEVLGIVLLSAVTGLVNPDSIQEVFDKAAKVLNSGESDG